MILRNIHWCIIQNYQIQWEIEMIQKIIKELKMDSLDVLNQSSHLLKQQKKQSIRCQQLQSRYTNLFTIIQAIDNDQGLPNELLQTLNFVLQPARQQHICQNYSYLYRCRTCGYDANIVYCPNCFDKEAHQTHNYVIQAKKSGCCCKKWWKSVSTKCKINNIYKAQQKQLLMDIKVDPNLQGYCSFLLQLFHRYINKSKDKRYLFAKGLTQVLLKVLTYFRIDQRYVQATAFCLISQDPGKDTLIKRLILFNKQERWITNQIKDIISQCLEVKTFAIKMMEEIFALKNFSQSSDLYFLQPLSLIVRELLSSSKVLACLIERQKLLDFPSMISIYYDLFTQSNMRNSQRFDLLTICKHLQKLNKLEFYMQRKQIKKVIINSASIDPIFLKSLIKKEIQNKNYKPLNDMKTDNHWFNEIVISILICVKGRVQDFATFFDQFDRKVLQKFVKRYFISMFRTKFNYKCNGLTMICLYRVAQRFSFLQLISSLGQQTKEMKPLRVLKFSQNLFIILRNLVSSEHVKGRMLMNIGQILQDEKLIKEGRAEIKEWFQDFLAYKKKITAYALKSLDLQFDEIENFVQKETKINEDGQIFNFIGEQRQIKDNFWFSNEKNWDKIQINYQRYDKQGIKCHEQIQQILMLLFSENIKYVDLRDKDFKSLSCNERYKVCFIGVLLNHFVRGRSINIIKYVETLKQMARTLRKKDSRLTDLFDYSFSTNKNKEIPIVKNAQISLQLGLTPVIIQIQQKKPTPILESNTKKLSKLVQMKEKFKKKVTKYRTQQEQDQMMQFCLVCRQNIGDSNKRFILAYLGKLKKDPFGQLIFNGFGSGLILSTCYHPIHFKCVSNKISSCILCKTNCNISLPVLNKTIESEVFTQVWWSDFIQKTNFQQIKRTSWIYSTMTNNAVEDVQKQNKVREELKTNPFRNFLLILKSLVIDLTKISVFLKKIQILNKNRYIFNLLRFYIERLNTKQRETLQEYLQKLILQLSEEKITQFTKKFSLTILKGVIIKLNLLRGVYNKQAVQKDLELIIEKYSSDYTFKLKYVMSWLMDAQFRQTEIVSGKGLSQITTLIFNISLPKDMEEAYKMRKKCQICFKMGTSFCLFCQKYLCTLCEDWNKHWRQFHQNPIIILNLETGMMKELGTSNSQIQLYFSVLGNYFFGENCRQLKKYRLRQDKCLKIISSFIAKV